MTEFTLDWSSANIDGANILSSAGDTLDVQVSTPMTNNRQWEKENFGNGVDGLASKNVIQPTVVTMTFAAPVHNINFELFDVDANLTGNLISGWDDKITVVALDADGNQVPVVFSNLAFHHQVNGNTVGSNNNVSPSVNTVGAPDSVTVDIAGPIVSLQIIQDNDGGPEDSGTVGVSDITFSTGPELDGYVEGTSGDDLIDFDYAGDPEGDRIDGNDAVLPGAGRNDDVVLAGDGDDTVNAARGDDLVIGGDGSDTLLGGSGNDIIYGDRPTHDGVLDFNSLSAGDLVNAQFIESGVRISSLDPDHPVMVFDSANPTGNDFDLGTPGNGNLLILSEDGDASDPDDNRFGGTMVFEFSGPATINSLDFIDQGSGTQIRLYDDDGNLMTQLNVPQGFDNTVITQAINVAGVARMEVEFQGSGAVDNLDFTLENASDDNDDVIMGEAGDDVIYGQTGNDTINGGTGADTLYGGTGSDLFIGGSAGDVVVGGEDDDGNDFDVLDLSTSNVESIVYEDDDPESGTVTFVGGSTMTFSEIEHVIPCFTTGTLIATPDGEKPVEALQVGDRVHTRDNGIQKIVWTGRKDLDNAALKAMPELRPVRIKKGALGRGLPERDMLVSPNHRMLIISDLAEVYFEQSEVLVAAKHLTKRKGIRVVDVPEVTYIHVMFDRHEVVIADGAWSESFQPGSQSLNGVDKAQRAEIFALFPELQSLEGIESFGSARRSLKRHEAELVLE